MTTAERVARHREAKKKVGGAAAMVTAPAPRTAAATHDDILHRLVVNPREAVRQIQGSEDGVAALRYTRADMDAAFEAGGMFTAAQQALGGAQHLRGVVDSWVEARPPLLWLFQVALSGSPWADEAEEAGWLSAPAS